MKILVAYEMSGRVREAFRRKGHSAWSCDILPSLVPSDNHIQDRVEAVLDRDINWDMMIAHPPCTALAVSGNRYYAGSEERQRALEVFRWLLELPIYAICVENPVGVVSSSIRPPDQYIQPYDFGEDASKKTGLWLKNLPLLKPTNPVPPRIVNGKKRWSNQTDSGQNRLGPSETRAMERGITYQGIADAMAEQWG